MRYCDTAIFVRNVFKQQHPIASCEFLSAFFTDFRSRSYYYCDLYTDCQGFGRCYQMHDTMCTTQLFYVLHLTCYTFTRYAVGGFDGYQMVSTVEVYEPRVGSWMPSEPMKCARGCMDTVTLGKNIIAIGGTQKEHEVLDTVCIFHHLRSLI